MICHYCTYPIEYTNGAPRLGHDGQGNVACYQCCAWLDVIAMMHGEPVALYATAGYIDRDGRSWRCVTNWPGTLRMVVREIRTGSHNMAGKRSTHYFDGPNGSHWSGVEYHGPASGNLLRQVRRLAS